MPANRREFLNLCAGTVATGVLESASFAKPRPDSKIKALAFDAFPVFDPRPVFALAETLFPGRGAELSNAWRTRQFEYTWLRTVGRHYKDFEKVTEDALVFSARLLKLDLTSAKRQQLMEAYFTLKAYPDVLPALKALKESGTRLAFLSNVTPKMLHANIRSAGLEGIFEHVLSTDTLKTYKPDPRAYQMGLEAFKLKREEIGFVAFAGWDATGAKWFGYPTFWVNRQNLPIEGLDTVPDAIGSDLTALANFVKSQR